ncbi:MAG: chaperone modulator CbpM [Pseudomonadota bacterium]
MTPQDLPTLTGYIVEEHSDLTLDELSGICAVEQQRIVEFVDEGILETRSVTEWRFGGDALRRTRVAVRLQRDLGVNTAGTALVLELLERIESLERQLAR